MNKKKSETSTQEAARTLPLFYRQPVILRFDQHRGKAIKPANGYGFSANTLAVPLMLGEFAHAGRHYPIVFAQNEQPAPVAMLGLREGQNLFLEPDGSWRNSAYVPAYLRRYNWPRPVALPAQ